MLAVFGLVLTVVQWEINANSYFDPSDPAKFADAINDPRNRSVSSKMTRLVVLITTILALYCLVKRHEYKTQWLNQYFNDDEQTHLYYNYQEAILDK